MRYEVGFNAEPIIHGMPKSLLAAEVFFCRLHRNMSEQKLDLFQLAPRIVTEPSARPPEIMWRKTNAVPNNTSYVRLNIAGKGALQLPSQIASEVLLHRDSYIRIGSEIRF